jgi:BirA family biotin operon repressor/biotin-[acetyl-CoA-carboxylase] ligase
VAAAVEHTSKLPARLKWPNDVHVYGKKVAGILTECFTDTERHLFAVIGIGLNVNHTAMPPTLAERAASLRQFTGQALDRTELAAAILRELASRLAKLDDSFDLILSEAARRSSILGEWIRLDASGSVLEGRAERLDAEGSLVLRLASGELRTVTAGEVTSQPGASRRDAVPDSK